MGNIMIKKSKIIAVMLGGVVSIGLVFSSFNTFAETSADHKSSQWMMHKKHKKHSHPLFMMESLKQLNLSSEQKSQMKTIVKANEPEFAERKSQMQMGFMKIRELTFSDADHQKEIKKMAEAQGELVTQSILQNVKVAKEMMSVLTEDQMRQLKQIKVRKMRKMKHMHAAANEAMDVDA
jgi:Spy/CpxP family protein refolding chaperone